jgi:transcriptional regulator with XRE-family HTH domain
MKYLAQRIKKARLHSNMSQSALAKRVGVTLSTVSSWESGRIKSLSTRSLLNLESATGFSARWLQYGEGPMTIAEGDPPKYID